MFNIFSSISDYIQTSNSLIPTINIPTINPSSQGCYSPEGQQLGTCLRQFWLDKNSFPKTNPRSLSAIQAADAGNFWEKWLIDYTKRLGIYLDEGFFATYPKNMVKGIVDVLIKNPITNLKELVEIKTFDGSKYYSAQHILGNSKITPSPRISHLLQSFRYLLIYKDQVSTIHICYVDRACASWKNNKQFIITLHEEDNEIFPKVEYFDSEGNVKSYINREVTYSGILNAEEKQKLSLISSDPPPKEFKETYDLNTVNLRYQKGFISDTAYSKYIKNPILNSIGDYQCSYCAFAKGTCSDLDN